MTYKRPLLRLHYEAPDVSTVLECIESPLLDLSSEQIPIDDIVEEELEW